MSEYKEQPEKTPLDREGLIKKWSEGEERTQGDGSEGERPFLNRPWILGRNRSKREVGLLGFFLVGLGLVAIFFMFGGKKEAEPMQQEEVFEVGSNRPISLPKHPPPVPEPPQKEEKPDKDALALKEARLKSAIVIFKKNGSGNDTPSQSNKGSGPSDPNRRFQEEIGSSEVLISQANKLGNLDFKILQGKIIDAVMETAVNSDLPGMVRAVVSNDIYGETGRKVLFPKGTRLVGQYNSAIRKGQARVFMVWNRAIRPDGIEIVLNSGGTDPLGRTGIRGKVNNHFWQIFGTSALLSLIGAGAANAGVGVGDQFNSISAYRDELANSFQESSSQVLNRYIDIPPTINIKQGARIKVFVARDLDFTDVFGQSFGSLNYGSNLGSWVVHYEPGTY